MKRTICVLLSVSLLSATAYAEDKKAAELTDPLEILNKVDAAARAVKSVKYDSVAEGPIGPGGRQAKIEASCIMTGWLDGGPEKYFGDAKVTLSGSAETTRITAGSDADMYFMIDHQGKIAYEDIDPAVVGPSAGVFARAWMIEFIHPTPFSDEINGRSRELKGSKEIGGEDCYEIHVVYQNERAPEAIWCVSKKDFLPRHRTDIITRPNGDKVQTTRLITNLVVDPKVDEKVFKLKLPEGYKKTDDFAPNLLPR